MSQSTELPQGNPSPSPAPAVPEAFLISPAPHLSDMRTTRRIMGEVILAMVPMFAVAIWMFGAKAIIVTAATTAGCLFAEAVGNWMRGRSQESLGDLSAIVTGVILGFSLPPGLRPYQAFIGGAVAIGLAKMVFGGLGQNLFNPAMVGYAALIVSFPVYMTQWPGPVGLVDHAITLGEALDRVFAGQGAVSVDAYTAATALDTLKTQARLGKPLEDILSQPIFGWAGGQGQEIVAAMYLLGGLALLASRVITWHTPVAFLAGVAATAGILSLIDPTHQAGPLFHLLSGGVMLGAFFIATDPVSSATTPLGKLIFAGLAGMLIVLIRAFGGYPDGVAFAILLMNVAAPLIDDYTQPRVFGHARRGRGQS